MTRNELDYLCGTIIATAAFATSPFVLAIGALGLVNLIVGVLAVRLALHGRKRTRVSEVDAVLKEEISQFKSESTAAPTSR